MTVGDRLQNETTFDLHPKGLFDASNGYTKQFLFERRVNMAGELIPMVLFVVIGFITIGFFYFNSKNRQSIMDTVQKAIDQGGELTPELLTKLGAAVNPRVRDMRRGIVFLALGVAGLLCSLFFSETHVVSGIRAGSMFPLLLGAAFLLVWRLNRNQE